MPLEIDNPFWQFSLRVYSAPGVSGECLELQDKLGADVNVILYAAWLGAVRGIVLSEGDLARIEEAVEIWSADVVQPLRKVRRRMAAMPVAADPPLLVLRKKVADTELFSEQIEQALLFQLTESFGKSAGVARSAAQRNMLTVLARYNGDDAAFPLRKLIAASHAAPE